METEAPGKPIAAEMTRLAEQFARVALEMAQLQKDLAAKESEYKFYREVVIPEAMENYGTSIFRLPDGTTIEIVPDLWVRIEAENEAKAFEYLEANGHGGLIKRQIIVAFNKDQELAAAALRQELQGRYPAVAQKSDVHWKTLTSWAAGRLRAGEQIDPSITVKETKVAKLDAPRPAF